MDNNQEKLAREFTLELHKVIHVAIEKGIEPEAALTTIGGTVSYMISMLAPEERLSASEVFIDALRAVSADTVEAVH